MDKVLPLSIKKTHKKFNTIYKTYNIQYILRKKTVQCLEKSHIFFYKRKKSHNIDF